MLERRHLRQCAACRHQSSATAGTVFEHSKLPLAKWFAAIYLVAADNGGVSALRLSKMVGVSWPTAQSMLRKLRRAMGDRDRCYWLSGLVEADDALVSGKRAGKRGRGAEGKRPVLFAVERKGDRAGFLAAQAVDGVTHEQVSAFSRRLGDVRLTVRSGCLQRPVGSGSGPRPRTASHPAGEGRRVAAPRAHSSISNFKRFMIGTFHGVSGARLQEYLDEFVFRFNRRFWEDQLPVRLVEAAVTHVPGVPLRLHRRFQTANYRNYRKTASARGIREETQAEGANLAQCEGQRGRPGLPPLGSRFREGRGANKARPRPPWGDRGRRGRRSGAG